MTTPITSIAIPEPVRERLDQGAAVFPLWECADVGVCSCPDGPQCASPGKHPRTRNGFKDASTDTTQVQRWAAQYPGCNWGMATGKLSGTVTIDIDPRNGGDDSLASLEAEFGELPPTLTQLTGGGGIHYVFKRPEGTGYTGTVVADGIDFKTDGGYIVISPSNHASGGTYEWDSGQPEEPAEMPEWLLKKIRKVPREYRHGGTAGHVENGFLGAAFAHMGLLGRETTNSGSPRAPVECPWIEEHTGGKGGGTVVFGPSPGSIFGHFHCAHSHCHGRTFADVVRTFDEETIQAGREAIGADRFWDPIAAYNREPPRYQEVKDPQGADDQWKTALVYHPSKGTLTKSPGNAALILANEAEWVGCIGYDEFADEVRWLRKPPSIPGVPNPRLGDDLHDAHITYVQHWFASLSGVEFSKQSVHDALILAARAHSHHPVRDYLDEVSAHWDGKARVDHWLRDYAGAPDDEYTSLVGRWWLISAVARVYDPGCQADHTLVLEGAQGAGKSQLTRILGGKWHMGSMPNVRSKEAAPALQGNWIVEIGEMDALKGAAGTLIKDFMSQRVDKYRPAYGRTSVTRPRHCVFVGTTNEDAYLDDPTGARRFWPVTVGARIDTEGLKRDRDQIWAEACALFHDGAQWHPTEAAYALVQARQGRSCDVDVWEADIQEWLASRPLSHGYATFTMSELMQGALAIPVDKRSRSDQARVTGILKRLGAERFLISNHNGKRRRGWKIDRDRDHRDQGGS